MRAPLAAVLAFSLLLRPFPASAAAPAKGLQKDLAYYQRVAKARNLGANDRLYILHTLKQKHAGAADLTPLLKEIDRWETALRTGKPPPPEKKPAAAPAKPAPPPPPPAAVPAPSIPFPERGGGGNPVLQNGDFLDIRVAPAKELDRELAVQPDGTIAFPLVGSVQAQGLSREGLERSLTQKLAAYVIEPEVRVTVRRFASNSVIITGRVATPGAVSHRRGLNVPGAILLAGGLLADADASGVSVYRGKDKDREAFVVDVRDPDNKDVENFILSPGDLIEVPQARDVSILGSVVKPGNYPYRQDLTLLGLVFEAGGLGPGAKSKSVFLYRQNESGRRSERINLDRIMARRVGEDPPLNPGDIVMVPQRSFYGAGAMSSLTPLFYAATVVLAVVAVSD
jgi:polysaccharide biosynthesis/export protein